MSSQRVIAEYRRLSKAKADIRDAMRTRGIEVSDEDRIDTYADKIRSHIVPRIKILRSQQLARFHQEILPACYIDPGYPNTDISHLFYESPYLLEVPHIEGIGHAVRVEGLIGNCPKIRSISLPELTSARDARSLASNCNELRTFSIAGMPQVDNLFSSASPCAELISADFGHCPVVRVIKQIVYNCPRLERLTITTGDMVEDCDHMIDRCSNLVEIVGIIDVTRCVKFYNAFNDARSLERIQLKGLKEGINLQWSVNLSIDSIRYMIDNAQSVSKKTIILARNVLTRYGSELEPIVQTAVSKGYTINYR